MSAEKCFNYGYGYIKSKFSYDGVNEKLFNIHNYISNNIKLDYPQKSHPKSPLSPLPIDKLFKLIGYYIADGSMLKSRNSLYPTIRHGRKIDKLESLVKSLGLDYSIYEESKIVIFHNDLGQYLIRCGDGSPNKQIPTELFNYSPTHLKHLFDGLMECDASKNGFSYYTTSTKLRDQVICLCLMLGCNASWTNRGKRTSIIKDREITGKHDCFTINISYKPVGYFDNRCKNMKKVPYNGKVWCLTTSTGNFITTREGQATLSGNSGKTQMCFTLAVIVQRPVEEGGLDGKTLYLDTERTFVPERIYEIAECLGYDPVETLKNIHPVEVYNSEHLNILVDNLHILLAEDNYKLVVVDSIIGHFRSEYQGRGNLAPRQQALGKVLGNLLRIALSEHVAVVVTNQVISNPSGYGGGDKPAGGNIMAHAGTVRVQLRKGRQGIRIAKIIDSSYLPEGEAPFRIVDKGIGVAKK